MTDCSRVAEALTAYDPEAEASSVAKAEEQRLQFVELFPRDDWASMTLDRYALGQPDHPDNFSRWMEFVTTELGSMKGGNARKHLIYFQKAAKEWWWDAKLFVSLDEAWAAVHKGFVDAIALAEAGRWDEIEQIPALRSAPALVNKMLSAYFPDEILPINSNTHLRHFLDELSVPGSDDPALGTTTLNRRLLAALRECPDVSAWGTKQLERLLYTTDLSPFEQQSVGLISDPASFIADALREATDERLETRRQSEDQARRLLDETAGTMTEEQARELFRLFNMDWNRGRANATRFSPAFVGQTSNGLVANLDLFNEWTARLWRGDIDDARQSMTELLANRKALPSAGTSYPSMLMYLRDPDHCAIWMRFSDQGLRRLTDYDNPKHAGNGTIDDYDRFSSTAVGLCRQHDIPPELLDFVLWKAGRAEESESGGGDAAKKPASAWIFQASPSLYDIDHAVSEASEIPWVVRQHKVDVKPGDVVYLWRSGSDAGVIAVGTVASKPEERAADPSSPYILKPEAFSKPEPRVDVRIDRVLPAVLRRAELLEHPVLKDLQVIAQPQGTNFPVSAEQNAALQPLLAGVRIPPLREELEDRVHLPLNWLREAVDLLTEKGQVIFFGPPGTGKTFVALALAEEMTRDGGELQVVQFHPSYSYEDFVGGFRPVEDDGAQGVRYQRVDGPLRAMAAAAKQHPTLPYVLIVDEINRGNIPKIFGELLFLLEYRQKSVRLQYWPEREFTLPPNLFVIGTMNTADRSIALVDAALRRRFYFMPFLATEPPVNEVLGRWLAEHEHPDEAARLLELLNREIGKDDVSIGPSYFMTDPDSGPDLERIWRRAIMPLLEEYYAGMAWDKERFTLPKLKSRLASSNAAEVDPSPDDNGDA